MSKNNQNEITSFDLLGVDNYIDSISEMKKCAPKEVLEDFERFKELVKADKDFMLWFLFFHSYLPDDSYI